jgi:hypothetical protein
MSKTKRELFVFYSRPLFRTCEIVCNHAARVLLKKDTLSHPQMRDELDRLNRERIDFQRDLNIIGGTHGHVCADCKGKCCGGVRERDAFIDRVVQDPETEHLSARRTTGEMAAYKFMPERSDGNVAVLQAECVEGHCPELTVEGCKIPYELRPIQCTAYFCRKTIDELSPKECDTGIRALAGLMRVQLRMVGLAMKSKFSSK